MRRLDPAILKQQVDQLLLTWPELSEDEILRADMIEGQTDFVEFLREIERKRKTAMVLLRGLEVEITEAKERLGRFDRREKAMRYLMFSAMQWADLRKLEMPEATLSIRDGMPKVLITDESQIPDEYMRIKKEPDKILIKQALNALEDVPGAAMSNIEPVLAIRVK